MTTVVYLGDRIIADTRASIRQKGFIGESGDLVLNNDEAIKIETFGPGFQWDDHRDIQLVGTAGVLSSMRAFGKFLTKLQCPLDSFLHSFDGREDMLYKFIGLATASSFILCLDTGESVHIRITERGFTTTAANREVKACGSGGFYFDATKDLFDLNPIILFRLAIGVDPSSSNAHYIEASYDGEKKQWIMDKTIKSFAEDLDPALLINSIHPNVKAMFKGTLSELSEVVTDPNESVDVVIPAAKEG